MSELDNIPENDSADEMQIHSFDVKDGVMNLKMTSGGEESEAVLLAMSDAMGELLDKHDATNYVEFDLHKRGRPAYSVCVRRFHKPTPHDLRVRAEATVARVNAVLSDYLATEDTDIECREDVWRFIRDLRAAVKDQS